VLRAGSWLVIAATCGVAGCNDGTPDDVRFVVSLDGSDGEEADGSEDAPFATLERARDAARAETAGQESDVLIELRAGTYVLTAPFLLGAADSGQRDHRMIYRPWGHGTDDAEDVVVSGGGALETLIASTEGGIHDVVLRGLTFTATAAPPAPAVIGALPAAVAFRDAERITIEDCRFQQLGGTAIAVTDGSYETIVRRNAIGDVAGAGIELVGRGEPDDERNIVSNNWVHDIGRAAPDAHAIAVAGLEEVLIANNQIDGVPSSGIVVDAGQERVQIAENLVFEAGASGTGAGIDVRGAQGTEWSEGTVISGNVVHDCPVGILADGADWLTIQGNVLYGNQHAVAGAAPQNVRIAYTYWDDPEVAWTPPVGAVDIRTCPVLPQGTALDACADDAACVGVLDDAGIDDRYPEVLETP
jgi:hypothetical protein